MLVLLRISHLSTDRYTNLTDTDVIMDRREDGEVRITINRLRQHNALSASVLANIAAHVVSAGAEAGTRLILLSGVGDRYFAAGGDLRELAGVRSEAAVLDMTNQARGALDAIRQCPVPVIACLNGDAIGGGGELAMACDMRLMSARARIGFIQGKLAITSAWGGGVDLFQLAGPSRAMRMMSRCELVSAEDAVQWGLVEASFSDGVAGADVRAFIDPMLRLPPQVLRGIKSQARALRAGEPYLRRIELEQAHLVKTWLHDDHWLAADKILAKGN